METREVILLTVSIVWSVHIIIALILLWRKRYLDTIRYRSPGLTIVSAISSIILIINYVALLPSEKLPCFLNLWIASLAQPLLYLSILARALRLLFYYKFSEARLAVALNQTEKSDYRPKSLIKLFTGSRRKSNGSSYELHGLTDSHSQSAPSDPGSVLQDARPQLWGFKGNDLTQNWYYRRRYMLSGQYISTVISIILMFHLGVAFVVQLLSTRFVMNFAAVSEDCMKGWEYYPHDVFACIYILICFPYLVYQLWTVKDAYGIRIELIVTSLVSCVGFCIFLISLNIDKNGTLNQYVPNSLWWGLPLMVTSFFAVTYPLINALRHTFSFSRRTSAETEFSMEAFESLLSNPIYFENFKLFTVSDFTVENVLFYERCRNVTLNTREAELNGNRINLVPELQEIYNTFIKNSAEFQVNLEANTRRALVDKAKKNQFTVDMYDQAAEEIKMLMFRNTYLRYLAHVKTKRVDWEGKNDLYV
ncbi:hypothetical protein K493DRAFT_306675 [Basidiobolus meristosporus CBS 931.73]|uniref:RGS domain-containing protein n=1 Tax=Basidiobolus meristosporus CBS 931.73 TaxID=1314790 RepID=A0A1Y1XRL9_9FUNG|nr:hypothetical protein K493DRAFT_306675 [Basidiobolus meristosporus CBS 931.73]|eukprot:ORX88373.1 hypothetical protein K493DRAFT_306675 [Basidiobolus meristosporus CBS 931.73]